MGSASNYLEDRLTQHVLGMAQLTYIAAPVYLAFFTSDPTDAYDGTNETSRNKELASANGYARTVIAFTKTDVGVYKNNEVTSPECSGTQWGTVTHIGIMDTGTARDQTGHLLFSTSLDTPRLVIPGISINFPANSIVITAT